jgi:transcriptional regulator with XRE-family HTH domain
MHNVTTALKTAIRRDGRTLADIALASGIDKGQLSRFMRDERTVTLHAADRLCKGLKLDVRLVPHRTKKGGER